MIRISQLKLPVGHTTETLEKKICQQLKIKKEELSSWQIVRRSLDARKKPDLKFVYVIDVDTPKERKILHRVQKVNDKDIMLTKRTEYQFPTGGSEKLQQPPVVIGSGPPQKKNWMILKLLYLQPVPKVSLKASDSQKISSHRVRQQDLPRWEMQRMPQTLITC